MLTTSGNLGLGVTPSAWNSSARCLDVLTYGGFFSENGYYGRTGVANNAYLQVGTADNYIYKVNSSAQLYDQKASTGEHRWFTAPSGTAGNAITFTQAMTLDASGNLGVGETSIASDTRLHLKSAGDIKLKVETTNNTLASGNAALVLTTGSYGYTIQNLTTTAGSAGVLRFYDNTAAVERARITSGGDLLVGTTSGSDKIVVEQSTAASASLFINSSGTATAQCVNAWHKNTTGDNVFLQFFTEASATSRGSISYNRTAGLVAYNTTSDYRAKDILGPVANSGATIDALKVYEGKMKGAAQSRPMLVAHEAQEHAPYAVTGEKDAVNADGTPKYQQMDVSSLVPLLLAEIQSLRARVKALEGA